MVKLKMTCSHCGSERVVKDAWASWDEDLQLWEVESVFDNGFCHDCDGEATINVEEVVE